MKIHGDGPDGYGNGTEHVHGHGHGHGMDEDMDMDIDDYMKTWIHRDTETWIMETWRHGNM